MTIQQRVQEFINSDEAADMNEADFSSRLLEIQNPVTTEEEPVPQVEPEEKSLPQLPQYSGLRPNEIRDLERAERLRSGEEQINPNEEEAARALASGVLATLNSVAGIGDIPARLRGE